MSHYCLCINAPADERAMADSPHGASSTRHGGVSLPPPRSPEERAISARRQRRASPPPSDKQHGHARRPLPLHPTAATLMRVRQGPCSFGLITLEVRDRRCNSRGQKGSTGGLREGRRRRRSRVSCVSRSRRESGIKRCTLRRCYLPPPRQSIDNPQLLAPLTHLTFSSRYSHIHIHRHLPSPTSLTPILAPAGAPSSPCPSSRQFTISLPHQLQIATIRERGDRSRMDRGPAAGTHPTRSPLRWLLNIRR